MQRTTVKQIQPQMTVDTVLRVHDKQHRANRQGNMYVLLQLSDKTGSISGMRWNSDDRVYDSIARGDYLRVQGTAQLHNGVIQLIVSHFELVDPSTVAEEEFDRFDRLKVDGLWLQLKQLIDSIQRPEARALGLAFYDDEVLANGLQHAPAGIKAHHAYPGGLLEHVVELMELVSAIALRYAFADRDLLMLGALLHDIGKLEELRFDGELYYSDQGQLLGHLILGIEMLNRKRELLLQRDGIEIDDDFYMQLQHLIVSHHGQLEHGSPKTPHTIEAIILHAVDDMDAKVNAAMEWIKADRGGDMRWTSFNPTLGRKFFKLGK